MKVLIIRPVNWPAPLKGNLNSYRCFLTKIESNPPTIDLSTEQALRFAVLWRKRSHSIQSDKGNRWVERILFLKQTCRMRLCQRFQSWQMPSMLILKSWPIVNYGLKDFRATVVLDYARGYTTNTSFGCQENFIEFFLRANFRWIYINLTVRIWNTLPIRSQKGSSDRKAPYINP